MGSCTRRHFLLSICTLQMLAIVERQIFDFLGYMWAPILTNFFHIIFVIFGIFGTSQFRIKYILAYSIWNLLWIGWNAFLICFYLNVGILNKDSDLLNLGTGSVSWFEVNGYGCKPTYSTNITSEDPFRPVRPERVDNCLLNYPEVEIIHSVVQLILSVLGILGSIFIAQIFLDEDDRLSRNSTKSKSKHRQSLYSIEFSPPIDTIRGRPDDLLDFDGNDDVGPPVSPKPMTPRRVKRRSVMTRGTTNRQSTTSRRSHSKSNRSSVRASRRKFQQNPVTKLMDHQGTMKKTYPTFQQKESSKLTESNLKYLNKDTGCSGTGKHMIQSNLNSFQQNISPDPIYYNMNACTTATQQSYKVNSFASGHYNPTYQHSTTTLNHSPDPADELYNNRPPSVRSSYSNFHGARHLSSYNPAPDSENVFVGLSSSAAAELRHQVMTQSQAIPQVPQRRPGSRESVRSMAFLNSGPPAYNLNYHTPPDSETTM